MASARSESELVAGLGDLLSATEIKTLCIARGFPLAGSSKGDLVRAFKARFLEPVGVAQAMAGLEPPWLAALHLVASSPEPLPVAALCALGGKDGDPYGVDWRSFWREVTGGLLSRGLALAVEGELPPGERSRYAGYELLLPAGFRRFLPPFPVETRPFAAGEPQAAPEDALAEALRLFARGLEPEQKGQAQRLPVRLARLLAIKDGILAFGGIGWPTDERVQATVAETWRSSLASRRGRRAPGGLPPPGRAVAHILAHIPAGTASSAAAVERALAALGLPVDASALGTFLAEGATAGLLHRSTAPGVESCYRAAPERPARTPKLKLIPAKTGVLVDPTATDLLPVLQAAAICRVSVERCLLLLVPDPIRMGRALRQAPADLISSLVAASPAFAAAVREVEAREGKVVVHSGLAVFRVEDPGLLALFLSRFPGAVRQLPDGFLACLASERDALLALAKKEGYVARREG